MSDTNVLIVGEAWQTLEIHIKGFDMFSNSSYHEVGGVLEEALEAEGAETDYLPTQVAATEFPSTTEEIAEYDVVLLSDVGYNTLAIPPTTFSDFEQVPNRLQLIEDFVRAGGGLLMVGGYLSFQGINGRANYHGTPVEEALPVSIQTYDDRVERSDGVVPEVVAPDHAVLAGLSDDWPHFLGYNRVAVDDDAEELVAVGDDPLIAVGEHGDGRSAVFTSDCAPHWGPPAFTDWDDYSTMWGNLAGWLAGE